MKSFNFGRLNYPVFYLTEIYVALVYVPPLLPLIKSEVILSNVRRYAFHLELSFFFL